LEVITITMVIAFDLKHPQKEHKLISMVWCKCIFAQYTIWANAVDANADHWGAIT